MKLGLEDSSKSLFKSRSQNARTLTEEWASRQAFCPNCGHAERSRFSNNRPVADLYCGSCSEEFELKSQRKAFGAKIVDGAYRTMRERLAADNNPNLMLLNYTPISFVDNLFIVPKHFFTIELIEKRKPLSPEARRAGWIGCNILLSKIPAAGKVHIIRDGQVLDKQSVLDQWRKTVFLRKETLASRGWLLNVLGCVESIGAKEFTLEQVYAFEARLGGLYPLNQHVRQKNPSTTPGSS